MNVPKVIELTAQWNDAAVLSLPPRGQPGRTQRPVHGDRDGAADALLEIISRDREWNDGAARARLLQILEAAGLEDPWASAQRRRLSALLFT